MSRAVYGGLLINLPKGSPMSTVPPAAPSVQLRVPTDGDALSWHRAFDDPEVMEFFGGTSAELSLYEEWTALPQALSFVRAGETPFAGTTPNSATACGPCSARTVRWSASPVHSRGRRPRTARWARPRSAGGSAGRPGAGVTPPPPHAARLTLERLRAAGVERVVAAIDSRNERSIAVARRLGMERAETFTTERSGQVVQCFRLALNA